MRALARGPCRWPRCSPDRCCAGATSGSWPVAWSSSGTVPYVRMTRRGASVISDDDVRRVSRRLRDLIEPLAANVYFAPESLENYKALGLSYIPSYFRSRSACMGDVTGEVVVATFGVFNPAIVLPAMEKARTVPVHE